MLQQKEKPEQAQKDYEAEQNLIGFFTLLFEVDKRNNPEKYRKKDD